MAPTTWIVLLLRTPRRFKVSVKAILSTDLVDKIGDNIFDSDKLSEEVKAQSKKITYCGEESESNKNKSDNLLYVYTYKIISSGRLVTTQSRR